MSKMGGFVSLQVKEITAGLNGLDGEDEGEKGVKVDS